MTDSDDIFAAKAEGLPVEALPFCADSLTIPNTIGIIRKASQAEAAEQLRDFLQKPEILKQLQEAGALETGERSAEMSGLKPDWKQLVSEIDPATETLKTIFLR